MSAVLTLVLKFKNKEERGCMLSFGRQPYAEVVKRSTQEDEEEDEVEIMQEEEEEEGEQVKIEPFIFPTATPVQLERPKELLPIVYGAMGAYFKMPGTVAELKRVFCAMPCLPLVVRRSPIVTLLIKDNIPLGNLPWLVTMFHLRSIMEGITYQFITVHPSVTPAEVERHGREFHEQMRMHEEETRVINADMDMATFTARLHEYSYYAIHCVERFIYHTLILPYMPLVQLEQVLTPVEWLDIDSCPERGAVLTGIDHFFTLKRLLMNHMLKKELVSSVDVTRQVYVNDPQLLTEYRALLLEYEYEKTRV